MSHTTFPRGTTLMNKDDEEEEEEVLEVSSSPSSSSKNNRAAACCMVSACRIKLSMAPANLSETTITVASSSPIAATFFFFFFFFYYRCSLTENWVPSSSSSSSYKDEKQRPLDPFSPPQPKATAATAAAALQLLRNLANRLRKMLSRHSRTSSSLVLPPPMALFIFLAVFVVQVLLRVYTNLLPMRVSPFLLSKPYYLMWLYCYCFCLPIICCSYKLAFRCCIQAAMKDEEQEVPRVCSQGSFVHCKRTTKN